MEGRQTLDQFIQELIEFRDRNDAGDMPVRVWSVYATGTNDGASVSISSEREYVSDTGEPYIVIR